MLGPASVPPQGLATQVGRMLEVDQAYSTLAPGGCHGLREDAGYCSGGGEAKSEAQDIARDDSGVPGPTRRLGCLFLRLLGIQALEAEKELRTD